MAEENRYTLYTIIGGRRSGMTFETDFPSVELARAGAIERVAIHNPWLNDGELANLAEPLQSLTLDKPIRLKGFTYLIKPMKA